MLTLSRPPYLRWGVAVLVVAAAFGWDLSERATELAPFAASDIDRGATILDDDIEWRPIPRGLFPVVAPVGASAATHISSGAPLTGSVLASGRAVPDGWWTVPVDIPATVPVGVTVRLVLPDGAATDGVLVASSTEDSFGMTESGLVAVAPELADAVALAAGAGQLVVLVAP